MFDNNEFKWEELQRSGHNLVSDGDVRFVNLQVKVLFEWSDEIISDYDLETGDTEYSSGYIMRVLPNQTFIYNGEKSEFIAQVIKQNQ